MFFFCFCLHRFRIVSVGETNLELVVQRSNGKSNKVTVGYSTITLASIIKDAGVVFNPAIEGSDFQKSEGVFNI